MNITFANSSYLWLLISIPLLIITHFFILKHLNARAWKFANFEAIKRVTGATPSMKNSFVLSKNILLLLIKLLVLAVMIFAIANPSIWFIGQSSDDNYVLAIDASSSMLADDFEPNRFLAAKKAAVDFIDSISSRTRIGLVSFAGTSYVEMELTQNLPDIKENIAKLDIKTTGGTDLGEAIITSANVLLRDDRPKTIILLTDGRSTVGTPLAKAVEYANQNHITIDTIGVATKGGGKFLRTDIISTLDEKSLIDIAQATGGKYFLAGNSEELKKAYSEIASSTQEKLSLNLQFPLILLALAMIFIEWGLVNTRYRTLP